MIAHSPPGPRNASPQKPDDVVIVSIARTPLTRAKKGGLKDVPPSTLLSTVLKSVIEKVSSSVAPGDIEDISVGNVLGPSSAAVGFRMAQLECGIPNKVPLSTTNRQCSSGLQACAHIAHSISAGSIKIGIGCGVESMSFNPFNEITPPDVDWERMKANAKRETMDCLIPMGVTSENVVKKYGMNREELDAFSAQSHQRAAAAKASGKFANEITPVGDIKDDDGIRPSTTAEKLAKLKPVFDKKNGVTTAGNSSQLTDGAAAVLFMSREEANRRNMEILGVWRGFDVVGVPPKIMGIGPAYAIPRVLDKVGLNIPDVDLWEINEAFASQALWSIRKLGLDQKIVNVNGGGISLGHPLGCTGARQVVTLINEMKRRKGSRYGVVSMCIGTGMGAAAVIEIEHNLKSSL